jgi:hypothetical protein
VNCQQFFDLSVDGKEGSLAKLAAAGSPTQKRTGVLPVDLYLTLPPTVAAAAADSPLF